MRVCLCVFMCRVYEGLKIVSQIKGLEHAFNFQINTQEIWHIFFLCLLLKNRNTQHMKIYIYSSVFFIMKRHILFNIRLLAHSRSRTVFCVVFHCIFFLFSLITLTFFIASHKFKVQCTRTHLRNNRQYTGWRMSL